MAMFGWSTLKMAEEYTRKADQEKLARAAMHLIETPEQNSTETCPTELPSGTISEKSSAKSDAKFGDGAQESCGTFPISQRLIQGEGRNRPVEPQIGLPPLPSPRCRNRTTDKNAPAAHRGRLRRHLSEPGHRADSAFPGGKAACRSACSEAPRIDNTYSQQPYDEQAY
jgi:hypothetical protein